MLLHNNCMELVLNILQRMHMHVVCQNSALAVCQNSALAVLREMMLQPEYHAQFLDYHGPDVFEECMVNEEMLDTAAASIVSIMYCACQSEKVIQHMMREQLVQNLVHVVDMFPSNKHVNKGAALMWEMATRNASMAKLLLQTTLVSTLVRMMGIYRKAAIQAPLMNTFLHLLAADKETAAMQMIHDAVIEACSISLKAFALSAEVVAPCVEVLIELVRFKESHEKMLTVPLLPDLITVIGQEGQDEHIQCRCVKLMKKLVFLPRSTLALGSVDDLKVVVAVMRLMLKRDKKTLMKAMRVVLESLRRADLYENIRTSLTCPRTSARR